MHVSQSKQPLTLHKLIVERHGHDDMDEFWWLIHCMPCSASLEVFVLNPALVGLKSDSRNFDLP